LSPRKEELRLLSSRDTTSGDVSPAGLQNEVLRLQQQLRLMTTHASKEERELVEEVKALRQECGRLRSEVLSKEAESDLFRQEVLRMKASLRHTLEDRRRTSGELTKSQVTSTTSMAVASPRSTRVAAGTTTAATPPKETVQQEKVVALKGQVEDLESMLRLQMQIKSNVVVDLHAKRQEVHELRDRLSLPPTTTTTSRQAINLHTARRLKGPVELRHQERKQSEKEQSETRSKTLRQEQEERHRHQQTLRALQSQRLHDLQARAARAAKREQQQPQGQQLLPSRHLPGAKFAKTQPKRKKESKKQTTNPSPPQSKLPSISGARRASSPDPVVAAPTATAAPFRTVPVTSLREELLPRAPPVSAP
jgi:myosin heavy subunit